MKKILIGILVLSSSLCYAHDIKMGTFDISKSTSGFKLEISLDRYDFVKSLLTAYPKQLNHSSDMESWNEMIEQYLVSNFKLTFNGACGEMEFRDIKFEEEYIRIWAFIPLSIENVTRIDVFNTCLLDYNDGHFNLVKANLNGTTRTFRLTEDRISTVIEY